jgi:hypothetical protein
MRPVSRRLICSIMDSTRTAFVQTLNPGKAFVADPAPMRVAASEERRLGLEG